MLAGTRARRLGSAVKFIHHPHGRRLAVSGCFHTLAVVMSVGDDVEQTGFCRLVDFRFAGSGRRHVAADGHQL